LRASGTASWLQLAVSGRFRPLARQSERHPLLAGSHQGMANATACSALDVVEAKSKT
jgi:hypothetical protein